MGATLDVMESAADTAAELAVGAAALLEDAAAVSHEARHLGRLLVKILIVALLLAVVASAVAKMRGGADSAPPERTG